MNMENVICRSSYNAYAIILFTTIRSYYACIEYSDCNWLFLSERHYVLLFWNFILVPENKKKECSSFAFYCGVPVPACMEDIQVDVGDILVNNSASFSFSFFFFAWALYMWAFALQLKRSGGAYVSYVKRLWNSNPIFVVRTSRTPWCSIFKS